MKTLYMIGDIGIDFRTQDVKDALEGSDEPIEVFISSGGGNVDEAIAMKTLFKMYKGEKTAYIMGLAASAMTGILLAFDKVYADSEAWYMIHNIQGGVQGDINDVESYLTQMRGFNNQIIEGYSKQTGIAPEEIKSMMDVTTYMKSDEAARLGFITGVVDLSSKGKQIENRSGEFKKTFDKLAASVVKEDVKTSIEKTTKTIKGKSMKYNSLLNLASEASEDQRFGAIQALKNSFADLENKLTKKTSEIESLTAKKSELENSVTTLTATVSAIESEKQLLNMVNKAGVQLSDTQKVEVKKRLAVINSITEDEELKNSFEKDLVEYIKTNGVKTDEEHSGGGKRPTNDKKDDMSYEDKVLHEFEKLDEDKSLSFEQKLAKAKEIVNAEIEEDNDE